ncbi:39S ribosomal protein L53, mitochondrial [Tupaia chinensis]|uniref:Large ribosomal subunit protein mL53 n=1 Tax=Tupaia chinensis TaxID=246437 RepID=L8Y3D4_TUPCH|nr:39S ribosomal protein L53, mitochondrial [Tupaia chinensis]
MASTVVAVGLTIAAAGFAGRYVLQAMKHMEPQVKQVFRSLPQSAFSGGYYRGSSSVLPLREERGVDEVRGGAGGGGRAAPSSRRAPAPGPGSRRFPPRTFLQAVSSEKVRSTNLNCSVIADVRHDGSEPCVDVLFGDGHRLLLRGAHLTALEMLTAFASHIQARGAAGSR